MIYSDNTLVILKAYTLFGYKFLARDITGLLYAYTLPPTRQAGGYVWENALGSHANMIPFVNGVTMDDVCPEIKWNDEEPTDIDNAIKESEDIAKKAHPCPSYGDYSVKRPSCLYCGSRLNCVADSLKSAGGSYG